MFEIMGDVKVVRYFFYAKKIKIIASELYLMT